MSPLPEFPARGSSIRSGEQLGRLAAVAACLCFALTSGCVTAAPHNAASYPPNQPIDCTSSHGLPVMWTTFTGISALSTVSLATTAAPADSEAKKQRDFALGFSIVSGVAAGIGAIHGYLTVEECREAKGGHWDADFETRKRRSPRLGRKPAARSVEGAVPGAGNTPSSAENTPPDAKGTPTETPEGVPSAAFPEEPQGAAPAGGAGQPGGMRDGSVRD